MSSSTSFIAPQPVVWETANESRLGSSRDVQNAVAHDRYDPAHQLLAAPRIPMRMPQGSAIVRQRFYPAQLRRLLNLDLMALSASRKHRLTWVGWDRSLPRLYLPVEPLLRLVMDAVDGITRQSLASQSTAASIRLRVEYQPVAHSTLVLALDADQWECDPKFRGALNARWFRPGSQAHLWQRLARQCDTIGGWLSVASLPGGGASLLINLPTDQPRALVHSWLSRQVASHGSSIVSLHAVGRNRIETIDELRAANIRLQSLARSDDYIYRASNGRWIWLTTASELPAFLEKAPWQSQPLDRWSCTGEGAAMIDLANRLDARFRELMGTRIPPIDLRTHAMSRGPVTARRPNTRVDQPVHAGSTSPPNHLNSHASSDASSHLSSLVSSQSKWRYPI